MREVKTEDLPRIPRILIFHHKQIHSQGNAIVLGAKPARGVSAGGKGG